MSKSLAFALLILLRVMMGIKPRQSGSVPRHRHTPNKLHGDAIAAGSTVSIAHSNTCPSTSPQGSGGAHSAVILQRSTAHCPAPRGRTAGCQSAMKRPAKGRHLLWLPQPYGPRQVDLEPPPELSRYWDANVLGRMSGGRSLCSAVVFDSALAARPPMLWRLIHTFPR